MTGGEGRARVKIERGERQELVFCSLPNKSLLDAGARSRRWWGRRRMSGGGGN